MIDSIENNALKEGRKEGRPFGSLSLARNPSASVPNFESEDTSLTPATFFRQAADTRNGTLSGMRWKSQKWIGIW